MKSHALTSPWTTGRRPADTARPARIISLVTGAAPAQAGRSAAAVPTQAGSGAYAGAPQARLQRLLEAVARADRTAFRELHDLTHAYLFGVARSVLGQRELAEEALQEAFISVWHHAAGYRADVAVPMTWLINIVRNRAIDLRRARRHEHSLRVDLDEEQHAHLSDTLGETCLDPLHLLQRHATETAIRARLASLGPDQRQAVALVLYRGMTHAEIAKLGDVPLSTAKAWVRRGMAKLSAAVDGRSA